MPRCAAQRVSVRAEDVLQPRWNLPQFRATAAKVVHKSQREQHFVSYGETVPKMLGEWLFNAFVVPHLVNKTFTMFALNRRTPPRLFA